MSTEITGEDEALIKNEFVMDVEGLDRWADLKKLSNFQKQVIRSVFVFQSEARGSSILFITTEDEVYGVGGNGNENILGLTGKHYQCEKVEWPVLVEDLSGKDVRVISVGEYVGAALDSNGSLYWWGECDATEGEVMPPHPVTKNPNLRFTNITCGSRYIAAINTEDRVFVWGKLGKGRKMMMTNKLFVHQHVIKISSGKTHLAMLTDQGEVYTWGCNNVGQRASDLHDNENDDYIIRKLQFNQICKDIACGFSSTICLSSSGDVWACGGNKKSWGLRSDGTETKLEKMTLSSKVTRLIVGSGHIDGSYQSMYLAITTNGNKYVWNDTDGPGLLISSPIIELFYENTSPKDIMYNVLYPFPTQYCIKCCNCLSSYKINHVTEEMQRKLDVINTIIVEIVRDLEQAKAEKGSTLEEQTASLALSKPNPKITNSIATQTEFQESLKLPSTVEMPA
uniref:RCC1 and BTB domain-containing protein 1 n=2 Tax=Lygus hesperus TaxID=30085 RepID=A0A146KQ32_LYGHE